MATSAIEALANLWNEVFGRIERAVAGWSTQPSMVGVFGSAARQDGDEASDIDVLVVSDSEDVGEQAGDLAALIQRWTGNAASVVTATTRDLRRMRRANEPILQEWERDLIVVFGAREALKVAS